MNDIYTTPESELSQAVVDGEYGSLERGVSGDYQFSIGEAISEAWEKTNGAKGSILLGVLIYLVIYALVSFACQFVFSQLGLSPEPLADGSNAMTLAGTGTLEGIVVAIFTTPISVGLIFLGVRRSLDAPITAGSVLSYYHKIVPLTVATILMYIMIVIGLLLLILPAFTWRWVTIWHSH